MSKLIIARALAALTDEQALHVYNALAQWADNERNGLDEASVFTESDKAEHAKHELEVATVESVVASIELELCS